MGTATGATAVMLGRFEDTYGTFPSGNFTRLPFQSANIGAEQGILQSNTLGFRETSEPFKGNVTAGGDATVPVDLRAIGFWLRGAYGEPTTTGSGPYVHSWITNAGAADSFSLEIGHPNVPAFLRNTGLKVASMGFGFGVDAEPTLSLSLLGRDETKATTSGGGSPVVLAHQRASQFQSVLRRSGSVMGRVPNVDLTLSTGLINWYSVGGGGLSEEAVEGIRGAEGTLTVRLIDTTIMDDALAGTPLELEFGYEIDANTKLSVLCHSVHIQRARQQVSGPGFVDASYAFIASVQPDGGPMATITLTNDVASY